MLQERIELLHRQWEEICHQVQWPLGGAVLLHMPIIVVQVTFSNHHRHIHMDAICAP